MTKQHKPWCESDKCSGHMGNVGQERSGWERPMEGQDIPLNSGCQGCQLRMTFIERFARGIGVGSQDI